jgi:hypothetical protein
VSTTRKEYRRRKVACDYARAHRLRVAEAHRQTEVIESVCAALGPLTPFQRNKVWRMLEIALETDPAPKGRRK